MEMERPEIVELFYSALINPNNVEQLFGFLGPRVEWILSPADPKTLGEELPLNTIRLSGTEGFRPLGALFPRQLAGGFWRPHWMHLPSPPGFLRSEESDCDLLERNRWQKQILLPELPFRARKLLNATYASLGRWFES